MELENITAGYVRTIEANADHALEYALIGLACGMVLTFALWLCFGKTCK